MTYLIAFVLFALGVVLLFVTVWGGIVAIAVGFAAAVYVVLSRRHGAPIGTVDRTRRVEPTGRPRAAHGGAETANRRTGQD
jgi:hypothetical protein